MAKSYSYFMHIFTFEIPDNFIKPSMRGLRLCAPSFLKLLWFAHRYVCVSVCVSTPKCKYLCISNYTYVFECNRTSNSQIA